MSDIFQTNSILHDDESANIVSIAKIKHSIHSHYILQSICDKDQSESYVPEVK